jgi:hypothetical protein
MASSYSTVTALISENDIELKICDNDNIINQVSENVVCCPYCLQSIQNCRDKLLTFVNTYTYV